MPEHDEPTVLAEVFLRTPDGATAEKVAALLREQGVAVSSVGAASLSIRCDRPTFERLFRTQLRIAQQSDYRQGVRDFGPTQRAAFQAQDPIAVPEALADEVEGIYLQEPPRRF